MIDRDTIIRMAREADATGYGDELTGDAIERFAALIAAAAKAEEREACAKVCADLHIEGEDDTGLAADLIRARGQT